MLREEDIFPVCSDGGLQQEEILLNQLGEHLFARRFLPDKAAGDSYSDEDSVQKESGIKVYKKDFVSKASAVVSFS